MSKLVFTQELAQKYYDSEEDFPMPLEEAWQYAGYSKKANAKQALINSGFVENIDWVLLINQQNSVQQGSQGGRPTENVYLSLDTFKQLGMMAGTEQGRSIRMYFIECEKQLRRFQKTSQPYLEVLKLGQIVKDTFKQLENLSSTHAAIIKQELIGNISLSPIQMKRDLDASLVANRLGLAFNKNLKTLELIQDTYSPEAYNKLKQMYHDLATEYNQLVESQTQKDKQLTDYTELATKYDALQDKYETARQTSRQRIEKLEDEVKVLTDIINDSEDKPKAKNKIKPLILGK